MSEFEEKLLDALKSIDISISNIDFELERLADHTCFGGCRACPEVDDKEKKGKN